MTDGVTNGESLLPSLLTKTNNQFMEECILDWETEFVRSLGEFQLYIRHQTLRNHPHIRSRRYVLYFKSDLFIHSYPHEPSSEEVCETISKWIQGNSRAVERQEHIIEPLVSERQILIQWASETCIFEIPHANPNNFIIDPFRFKLTAPGKYHVYVLDHYVDWTYFSSSDMNEEFEPAHDKDTEGFRSFLRRSVQAMENDKPRRQQERIQKRRKISEIESAFAKLQVK